MSPSTPRPLLLAALLALAPTAHADTFLWRVSDGDAHLFLGGTLHVLDEDDYPLPEAFDTAYEAADTLVVETDVRQLEDPARQAAMMQTLTYGNGAEIFDALDDETDERLVEFLAARGLPVELFATFRPGMLLSALTVIELQRLGIEAQGVEEHYLRRADADDVSLVQLETPEQQIDMLAALGGDDPDELVDGLLDDMDELDTMMSSMTRAWREGDPDALDASVLEPMRERMPDGYAALIADRNRAWMPELVDMLETDEVELVLVGAGHLVGEDGLLASLREAGYTLEQL